MRKRGFTLIELLLYMALITIIMSALMPFAWNLLQNGDKSKTQENLSATGRFIAEKIKYEVRNASTVTSVTSTTLTLPTSTFNLTGGNLQLNGVNLNPSNTSVTNLTFTNNSSLDLKSKNVGFVFTVNANYGSARQEYQGSLNFRGAAEVRSN